MAANKKELGGLHSKFTKFLADELEMYIEEGIPMAAADKTVIMTFLKNNNITAESTDEDLQRVREQFSSIKEENRDKALAILKEAHAESIQLNPEQDPERTEHQRKVQCLLA